MRKGLLLLGALLMALGCETRNYKPLGETEVPQEVLPVDSMSLIMEEIHLAEAKVNKLSPKQERGTLLYLKLQDSLLNQHGLDTGRLNRSFRFYTRHPVMMEKVYERVVDSLKSRQHNRPKSKDGTQK